MAGNDHKWIRGVGFASSIGFLLVTATVIGWLFGSWLDRKLGTEPWLMMLFTLLGVAAGFYETFRIIIRISKDS